jgi:hypothetical protein
MNHALVVPLRLQRRLGLDSAQSAAVPVLAAACAVALPGCTLRLNRNRRTMLSLRGHAGGRWTLSVHVRLLGDPRASAELPSWCASHGRRTSAALRQALRDAWLAAQATAACDAPGQDGTAAAQDLLVLGGPVDLPAELERLHAGWFGHLPQPEIRWSRRAHRRLSHIRFGSYRRDRALICLHPRLDQPWVARIFVEHVIFHELCHHAQACAPLRREPPHSPRFRAWERSYPHHDAALAWERRNLARLLDG